MARKSRMSILKRKRELKRMEKAAKKREKKQTRKEDEFDEIVDTEPGWVLGPDGELVAVKVAPSEGRGLEGSE